MPSWILMAPKFLAEGKIKLQNKQRTVQSIGVVPREVPLNAVFQERTEILYCPQSSDSLHFSETGFNLKTVKENKLHKMKQKFTSQSNTVQGILLEVLTC